MNITPNPVAASKESNIEDEVKRVYEAMHEENARELVEL